MTELPLPCHSERREESFAIADKKGKIPPGGRNDNVKVAQIFADKSRNGTITQYAIRNTFAKIAA